MGRPLRVVLADDHYVVRAGVEALLRDAPGVEVAGRAASGEELLAEVESAALYVVSEGLANVLRHANASTVILRITAGADPLTVEVEDDGVGGADSSGSGLRGLRDRVEAAGGRVDVQSQPGRTLLRAMF